MHAAFMLYGKKEWVEFFLRDIASQKYTLTLTSPNGKKTKQISIEGQLRIMPFGIYEHIFPKEHMASVLTALDFHNKAPYNLPKSVMAILRKVLRLKKPKKFNTDKTYFWIKNFVSIIPLGIREDGTIEEKSGEYKGWSHEAI